MVMPVNKYNPNFVFRYIMKNPHVYVISVLGVMLFSVLFFILWVLGWFEKFQPEIEIVLPEGFSGVVCATTISGSKENKSKIAHFEVSQSGLLLVEGNILRSHRKRKYFYKSSTGKLQKVLTESLMEPIFTENDLANKISYTVYWVGSSESWSQFVSEQKGKNICIGKY